MATLKFNNIQKIYPNHVQAVFDFNLEIKDKEFIVFVGPSGCGKSTTLRMIAGLEDISDGELYIDNKLVNFVDPKERNIAMVFQSYALYPHMTVYDNIGFSLKIRTADKKIFVKDAKREQLIKEISVLRRQLLNALKKADRNHKKKQELLDLAYSLKKQVEEKFKEYHTYDVYQKGISNELIQRNKKIIRRTDKEIKTTERHYLSGEKEINKEKDRLDALKALNDPKLAKKIKKLEAQFNYDSHTLNMIKIELESKKEENAEASKNLDYYTNNEVELIKNRHLSKNEILEEVLHAADILDLFKYLYRKPAALSGGQRQRVALGRAIVRKPKVFLMDEPLSNLDAKLRTQTRTEIAHIHKEVGATTIYVTHDQVEALTLADRIVIMKDGVVQQVCTPKEAYNHPANMFVAGFIGSPATNFLNGVFDGEKVNVAYQNKTLEIKLTQTQITALKDYVNKEIVVGIRPEYMHLKSEHNAKKDVSFVTLPIKDIELIGHEFIMYFDINGKKLSAKASSEAKIKANEEFDFVIENDKLHLFDKDSTLTII